MEFASADPPAREAESFPLAPEHRMLLQIRDTLYEGHWNDFESDLRARAAGRPHVFQTMPVSPQLKATIATHLALIGEMRAWEAASGHALKADRAG